MTTNQPILTIDVPGRAVSANARLGYNRRTGRKFLTKAAREWKDTVAMYAFAEYALRYRCRKPHRYPQPPLRIVCHVRGCRADADNLSKLILDGLADGIGIDDRHFRTVEMHATAKGRNEPGATIEVYEADEDRAA